MNLKKAIHAALDTRIRVLHPEAARLPPPHTSYLADPKANLVGSFEHEVAFADLASGDGNEFSWNKSRPPKFQAIHSSSALAVNCFGPYRTMPSELSLAGVTEFDDCRFEDKPCPLVQWKKWTRINRTPKSPNLDFVAQSQTQYVAVESKLTEWVSLGADDRTLRPSYRNSLFDKTIWDSGWIELATAALEITLKFRHVGVAQLIKHYLALRWRQRTQPEKQVTLMYLFWEPQNAKDFSECRQHRDELIEFSRLVADSAVTFCWKSYSQLWDEWEQHLESDSELADHVKLLKMRYNLDVPLTRVSSKD
jgi:hypothetical protein